MDMVTKSSLKQNKNPLSLRLSQKISQLRARVPAIYETLTRSAGGTDNLENVPKILLGEESPEACAAAAVLQNQPPPWLLQYKSEVIAQQFCLIEQEMFKSIKWTELLDLSWKKKRKEKKKLDYFKLPPTPNRLSKDLESQLAPVSSDNKRHSEGAKYDTLTVSTASSAGNDIDDDDEESGVLNLIDRFNVVRIIQYRRYKLCLMSLKGMSVGNI
jgi:hypothetical protein